MSEVIHKCGDVCKKGIDCIQKIPAMWKLGIGSLVAGLTSLWVLSHSDFFDELAMTTVHNFVEYCIAVLVFVGVDRYLLKDLNITDMWNKGLPANTRAAIVLGWSIVLAATIYFFS